jgi:ADP-ribose pyrophosphatase YjhB (NUDIX family)
LPTPFVIGINTLLQNILSKMSLKDAVKTIDSNVPNAQEGLPQDVFYLASRLTPMVNVDLLVKDSNGRVLLSWRDDEFAGKGWHIPGGIIRFKEKASTRIQKVAQSELGVDVLFEPTPISFNEIICSHDTRGHFISLLYSCTVPDSYVPDNKGKNEDDPGFIKWHRTCPKNLVRVHEPYRTFIEESNQ